MYDHVHAFVCARPQKIGRNSSQNLSAGTCEGASICYSNMRCFPAFKAITSTLRATNRAIICRIHVVYRCYSAEAKLKNEKDDLSGILDPTPAVIPCRVALQAPSWPFRVVAGRGGRGQMTVGSRANLLPGSLGEYCDMVTIG